jgi:uncharacterized protein YlxW (UPF0749 family)
MIKKYIIVGLVSILIIFGITLSIKCARLEKENIKLKMEQNDIVDSIRFENRSLKENVSILESQVVDYEHKIDSLKKIKQKVIVEYKYVISKDLIDGVETLKNNIKCEKYYQ